MNQVITYLIILIYYLIFDFTMISLYNGKAFGDMIYQIQKQKMEVRTTPTILAFLILAFGLNYFILEKIRDDHLVLDSLKYGFIFGLVVYGVYDMTNYATIKNYTLKVALVDWIWGGIINFIVILLTKLTLKHL